MKARVRPTNLFISYSYKDDESKRALEIHLAPLRHEGLIDHWSEQDIESGKAWTLALDKALSAGDLALMLVSSNFLASAVHWTPELSAMLARDKRRRAQVVPVILKAVQWADSPLRSLKSLPRNRKPVSNWSDQEAAWDDVQQGIREVVESRLLRPDNSGLASRSVAPVNGESHSETDSLAREHAEMMSSLPRHLVDRVEFLIEKRDSIGHLSEDEDQELQELAARATELATRHLAKRLSDAGQR